MVTEGGRLFDAIERFDFRHQSPHLGNLDGNRSSNQMQTAHFCLGLLGFIRDIFISCPTPKSALWQQ